MTLTEREVEVGAAWYPNYAIRAVRLGARYGHGERETLAAFAALSPRLSVRGNVQALYRCLVAHRDGLGVDAVSRSMAGKSGSGVMRNRVTRAFQALDGDVSGGITSIKVRSFYCNLRGRTEEVTVDTWAAQPFGLKPGAKFGLPVYREIRAAYQTAALVFGLPASTIQAAVWVQLRGGAH